MASTNAQKATNMREDYSRFVVHLTRDDSGTFTNGATARENFISILKSRKIYASRPHCLYNKKLECYPQSIRKQFFVSCFTEVPLSQMHLLTQPIVGRQIELQPFGFVFTKEFIVKQAGQPAIYVNSYNQECWIRECVEKLFELAIKNDTLDDPIWRILPFVNAMNEHYDFSWEREWRFRKTFNFTLGDLVCVIIPPTGEEKLRENASKAGVATISPGWTYEQIIHELSNQQRDTKRLMIEGETLAKKK